MHELISKCQKSLITVDKYYDAALQHVRGELIVNGKLSRDNLDREQHAAHGLSWVAAYRATLKEMVNWAQLTISFKVALYAATQDKPCAACCSLSRLSRDNFPLTINSPLTCCRAAS